MLNRRALEVRVFSHVAQALRRGELYVVGSEAYDDYRRQLLPWEQCSQRLAEHCGALKMPDNGQ